MRRYFATSAVFLTFFGAAALAATPKVAREKVSVQKEYTHDTGSYTQGLFFYGDKLYESAGQYGESSMRIVDLKTGKVLKRKTFERRYFIEGSCILCGRLYILTWREGICFICNPETLEKVSMFHYRGEGWGLTTDGTSLIMSDGSSVIRYRDPWTFAVQKEVSVTMNGKPLNWLNELEYIDGQIWANVYGTDAIVKIDPATGIVAGVLDCSGILPASLRRPTTDVLNGIAYDPKDKSVYITGKYWPRMFKIK